MAESDFFFGRPLPEYFQDLLYEFAAIHWPRRNLDLARLEIGQAQ